MPHTPQDADARTGPAVYAGSFDPPTRGHLWMIEQGAVLFDRLIVAVALNPEKRYSFDLDTRLAWLRSTTSALPGVEVRHIGNTFLAHFARDVGASYIIRGIRNEADYQYERAMRYVNADLNPRLTTVFLMPPRDLCELSSSFVRGMIGPDGWERVVQGYVPEPVWPGLRAWGLRQTTPPAQPAAPGSSSPTDDPA